MQSTSLHLSDLAPDKVYIMDFCLKIFVRADTAGKAMGLKLEHVTDVSQV